MNAPTTIRSRTVKKAELACRNLHLAAARLTIWKAIATGQPGVADTASVAEAHARDRAVMQIGALNVDGAGWRCHGDDSIVGGRMYVPSDLRVSRDFVIAVRGLQPATHGLCRRWAARDQSSRRPDLRRRCTARLAVLRIKRTLNFGIQRPFVLQAGDGETADRNEIADLPLARMGSPKACTVLRATKPSPRQLDVLARVPAFLPFRIAGLSGHARRARRKRWCSNLRAAGRRCSRTHG